MVLGWVLGAVGASTDHSEGKTRTENHSRISKKILWFWNTKYVLVFNTAQSLRTYLRWFGVKAIANAFKSFFVELFTHANNINGILDIYGNKSLN